MSLADDLAKLREAKKQAKRDYVEALAELLDSKEETRDKALDERDKLRAGLKSIQQKVIQIGMLADSPAHSERRQQAIADLARDALGILEKLTDE